MCVMSMVGDYYGRKWENVPIQTYIIDGIGREEFEQLKKEVADMKALLKMAKQYDKEHGQPDCEVDAKMAKLKEIAKLVGEVLGET